MKGVYVCGPMTGIYHFNFPAFDEARDFLLETGLFDTVFSPADHDRKLLGKELDWLPEASDTKAWAKWAIEYAPSLRQMLGEDLAWIAQNATHLYMLKGWERSRGAVAEHALGVALDLEIMYQ